MKPGITQIGMRENTASSRQHDSRFAAQSLSATTASPFTAKEESFVVSPSIPKTSPAISSNSAAHTAATGGEESETATSESIGRGKRSAFERPLTCNEAAALVRAHPKTVKRMARSGELPGYFRFGRWFFYASELDRWMRGELNSTHRPCR